MNTETDPGTDLQNAELGLDELLELSLGTDDPGASARGTDLLSQWRKEIGQDEFEEVSPSLLYNNILEPRLSEMTAAEDVTFIPNSLVDLPSIEKTGAASVGLTGGASAAPTGMVSNVTAAPTVSKRSLVLPGINDEIHGFKLLHELGRGAFAKVFLGRQGKLADREVVLKISAIEGEEPQTLAQLQHTHVVPIYSVHDDVQMGLRVVCMPYFGGASLSRVLKKLWEICPLPGSGTDFLRALDDKDVSGPAPVVRTALKRDAGHVEELQSSQTVRNTLSSMTYVQTAAWVICRLAEGLQHSHERNIVHRDIKPSNILISAEGQPLLLDFNVSAAGDCDPTQATVGGTLAYMAPEQLRAMKERNAEAVTRLARSSDIYSLGLVLYEMLYGRSPFVENGRGVSDAARIDVFLKEREHVVPSLKARCKLEIPWSLESIVRKSLAVNPAERYKAPAQLAEDLHRFLQDLPLKFAPELSNVERARKWARRHPRLTTASVAMLIASMMIVPGGLLLSMTRDDLAVKKSQLEETTALQVSQDFVEKGQRALCMIDTVTENEETLTAGKADVEKTLGIYGVLTNPDWQAGVNWRRLGKDQRRRVAEDVRELLLELASAEDRRAPQNAAGAKRALTLVGMASNIEELPSSRALMMDKARYLRSLKRNEEAKHADELAETIPAVSAHDLYMLAAARARQRTVPAYREAIRLLSRSIELSPKHYWSYFKRALCYNEVHETLSATSDLGACIALWPESASAHFNRGYFYWQYGLKEAAVADFSEAIRHSPQYQSAWLNRGLVRLEIRDYQGARKDFECVRQLGRIDAVTTAGLAMALEGLGKSEEADKLFEQALSSGAKDSETATRIRWTYAFAVAHRSAKVAHRFFDEILSQDPLHPQANYGKGMLYMQERRLPDAVQAFDNALDREPNYIDPLRYRAIALARMGKFEQAVADANACTARDSVNPDNWYISACVSAVAYRQLRDHKLFSSTLDLLTKAIQCGVDRERAVDDPDFSAFQDDPEFQELVGVKRGKKTAIPDDI